MCATQFLTLTGNALLPYLDQLAELRIRIFRDFPYLYEGTREYERDYLDLYVRSKKSIVILVLDAGKPVGASTGLPMVDADPEFSKPFLDNNFDVSRLFYFGESVLEKDYRGRGIGKQFFPLREDHARKHGFTTTCFSAVDRDPNHPGRPKDYQPLDPFWQSVGYQKQSHLITKFSWLDIGSTQTDEKQMTFWIKQIRSG